MMMKRRTTAAAWQYLGQQYERGKGNELGLCIALDDLKRKGGITAAQRWQMRGAIRLLLDEQHELEGESYVWNIFLPSTGTPEGRMLRAMLAYMLAEQAEAA
jgi:hypothetical protein